ncbi:hypothetical protein SprV_0100109200 [Sparganum proliferum]
MLRARVHLRANLSLARARSPRAQRVSVRALQVHDQDLRQQGPEEGRVEARGDVAATVAVSGTDVGACAPRSPSPGSDVGPGGQYTT